MVSPENLTLFSGNANPGLATQIAEILGVPLGNVMVGRFSDGEINVEVMENVRGRDVFIVQPTCAPGNDNLMELLVMMDAIKRSSAGRITAVIPYFGYARQDRRPRTARVAISAKLVAEMIGVAGADRILTMDLHADQIQGYFDIPTDNIYGSPVLLGELWRKRLPNPVVVSPDVGGVVRARAMAKQLGTGLAIIDKRRPKANEAKVMHILGDVSCHSCIPIDAMVDTAITLCEAARALKEDGATKVLASCTHPVLSGQAIDRIMDSEINELLVTNSIPLSKQAQECSKITQLSVAKLLAESIRRIATGDSISNLFID